MENIVCKKCNKTKQISEFYKSKCKRKLCKRCFYNIYIKKNEPNNLILFENEIYSDIDNFYIATSKGRIFSKPIDLIRKNGWQQKRGYMELKQVKNNNGYMTVRINQIPKTVHRLVLMAFNKTDNKKLHVNHINGVKNDNRLENLEWVTSSENIKHAIRMGLINTIKVDCFLPNGTFIKKYNSVSEICSELNVSNSNIYAMINNKKYPKTIKGFIFKKAINIKTLQQ